MLTFIVFCVPVLDRDHYRYTPVAGKRAGGIEPPPPPPQIWKLKNITIKVQNIYN